jgi:hypothetical protein
MEVLDGSMEHTLDQWLKQPGADAHKPIRHLADRVGIHDSRAIEHVRTYLWDLSDYRVDCVQAGVIWLVPR